MEEVRFEIDGKDYYIKPIDTNILSEAQKVYNKTFRKAMEEGALLKKRLESHMREQGLWDDKKEEEYRTFIKKIADLEYQLKKGGLKLSAGRELAIKLKKLREDFRDLINERNYLDSVTAEGQSDNARFNYLVSACVYDFLTRKPVFENLDDYKLKISEELSVKLAAKFATCLYEVPEDYESSLLENKFLKRFKLVDEKGFLLNKDGQRVDLEGNLINDEGYRIDKNGERIDINNNPIVETDINDVEFEDDFFMK